MLIEFMMVTASHQRLGLGASPGDGVSDFDGVGSEEATGHSFRQGMLSAMSSNGLTRGLHDGRWR